MAKFALDLKLENPLKSGCRPAAAGPRRDPFGAPARTPLESGPLQGPFRIGAPSGPLWGQGPFGVPLGSGPLSCII